MKEKKQQVMMGNNFREPTTHGTVEAVTQIFHRIAQKYRKKSL